jgi:hypothetical protein
MAMKTATKRIDKPSERRRAPRRQPALGTICQFAPTSALQGLGLVWNISTSGVSVLANRPCAAGVRLDAELRTLDERATLPITFDVAHVKELGTGDYVIAGPFPKILAAAQIKPFISMPARARPTTQKMAR